MIARLPTWIWLGGWTLAFIAGMVNAIGFLGIGHDAISHVTGTATLSAIALRHGDWERLSHLVAIIGAFFIGAVASGAIVQHGALKLGRRYGVAFGIESIALLLSFALFSRGQGAGVYPAAFACGLQNAMATSYSGAVVRTTHLTGILTDMASSATGCAASRGTAPVFISICFWFPTS